MWKIVLILMWVPALFYGQNAVFPEKHGEFHTEAFMHPICKTVALPTISLPDALDAMPVGMNVQLPGGANMRLRIGQILQTAVQTLSGTGKNPMPFQLKSPDCKQMPFMFRIQTPISM